jgi:FAD synthetase
VKSAALIVIGDEILTGKIKDDNSLVFAQTMFDRGVRVKRIVIIPDDISLIAESVARYSSSFDYVCTSGGVGPTHDDMTFEGVAKGFLLPLKEHEEALCHFQEAQERAGRGKDVSDAQKKMLCFPTPCQVFFIEPLWLPLVVVNNVYIYPGVPFLFEKLMTSFAHLFKGRKFFRETLFTDRAEAKIAFALKQMQDQNPDVAIGFYPQMPGKPYNVLITIEGVEQNKVIGVATQLLPLIGGRKIAEDP